jgi:hypothetical protein
MEFPNEPHDRDHRIGNIRRRDRTGQRQVLGVDRERDFQERIARGDGLKERFGLEAEAMGIEWPLRQEFRRIDRQAVVVMDLAAEQDIKEHRIRSRYRTFERRHRGEKIVGIGRHHVGLAEMAEQFDERAQRPGIVGRGIDHEGRARLAAPRDHAISEAHASVVSMPDDEGVFLARLLCDGCGVVGAAVVEDDDAELLHGDRKRAVDPLDRAQEVLRIVMGNDEHRQCPRTH